jgi:pyruvate,water dikinase
VGLLRSELMLADLLSSQVLAQWQESFQRQFVATLSNYLRQFGSAFAPRPVFYRSLDLYGNSLNPVLGDRGTYNYVAHPTLFDLELEALQTVAQEGYHNIKLILPFVRSVDEFKFCYRRLENIGLTVQNSFQVWIMAEVPSVIMLLPEYIRAGVQGITIGTNDLTQLLLGVDREQNQFSDRGLNANHPAMHKAIAELIKTAHDYNIECCICGQAPVDHPDLIDKLVQWGINTISVEPDAVAQTYKAIARAEKRMLLDRVRH